MPTWFDELDFVKDPYEKLDPYKIDLKYLVWDRPDLPQLALDLERFAEDISNDRRTAMKIFGSTGSGKTWLTRIIEKKILAKKPGVLFIYTKVPKLEPTFQTVYRLSVQYILDNHFDKIVRHIKDHGETDLTSWKKMIQDEDLAAALEQYYSGTNRPLAKKWLIGDKLSASELGELKVTSSLDSEYDRFEMLTRILHNMSSIFSGSLLVIDELENAPVRLAGQLSDSLRDILDTFSEKFALVASVTVQKDEEWYDLGYTEQLGRRFDYVVGLEALSTDKIAEFLRKHHEAYRKADAQVKDQLFPFSEDGAASLLETMPPGYRYPGYYLPNCRDLTRLSLKNTIDTDFVRKHQNRLTFK